MSRRYDALRHHAVPKGFNPSFTVRALLRVNRRFLADFGHPVIFSKIAADLRFFGFPLFGILPPGIPNHLSLNIFPFIWWACQLEGKLSWLLPRLNRFLWWKSLKLSDNVIFLVKIYFRQFFMIKKMVLRFTINFGVILMKISVAIATDILEIAILLIFGCHGNQIKYGRHGHSTYKIWKYLTIPTICHLFHLNWWRESWVIAVWILVEETFFWISLLYWWSHISLIEIDMQN